MGLSTAERNKRKRERKKREREELKKQQEAEAVAASDSTSPAADDLVEVEYVAEPILSEEVEGLRNFQELVALTGGNDSSLEKEKTFANKAEDKYDDDDDNDDRKAMSKRKLREMLRPSVAELKRKVAKPELVEAHDITAADPEFLIELKSVPGTVPVPRNWGRKRKYLQGKVSSLFICFACSIG